jgi:hypothetical protein
VVAVTLLPGFYGTIFKEQFWVPFYCALKHKKIILSSCSSFAFLSSWRKSLDDIEGKHLLCPVILLLCFFQVKKQKKCALCHTHDCFSDPLKENEQNFFPWYCSL